MTTQYVMQTTDSEWLQPTPVRAAIREELTTHTDLETDDLDELEAYVDFEEIQTVLEPNDTEMIAVAVEGHDVQIHQSGEIELV